jgi:hypothetical protein
MGLSLAVRRARLLLVRDAILAHSGGALQIYGSVYPGQGAASAEPPLMIRTIGSGDLVVHATEASMTLSVEGNVALSGLPNWARFVDGESTPVHDCTAGAPGSGAALIVSNGEPVPSSALYPGGIATATIAFVEAE